MKYYTVDCPTDRGYEREAMVDLSRVKSLILDYGKLIKVFEHTDNGMVLIKTETILQSELK